MVLAGLTLLITGRKESGRHFSSQCVFLKKGNANAEGLACTSLVHPIVECGAACWGPFREGQMNALDRVHKNAVEFANLTSD